MKKKGQIEITELLLIIFFIIAILVAAMFVFAGFQTWQFGSEKNKERDTKAIRLMQRLIDSEILTDRNSLFNEKKLLAIGKDCKSLQKLFGRGWYMEIAVLDGKEGAECGNRNYDSCNFYAVCREFHSGQQVTAFDLPVNVKKSIGGISTNEIFTYAAIAKMRLSVYD